MKNFSRLAFQIQNEHPFTTKAAFAGSVAMGLLSLLLYFKVSLFTFLLSFLVGTFGGFFFILFVMRRFFYSLFLELNFSTSGIFFHKNSQSLFIPWYSISQKHPFSKVQTKLMVHLTRQIPGLDFNVLSFKKDFENDADEPFYLENGGFVLNLPDNFWPFFNANQTQIFNLLARFELDRPETEASILIEEGGFNKQSCCVLSASHLAFPAFCPFSEDEVDTELLVSGINLKVSASGYRRYLKKEKIKTFLKLSLPLLFAFFVNIFWTQAYGVFDWEGVFLAQTPFFISYLFFTMAKPPVVVKKQADGKVWLTFKKTDYFLSFVHLNLKERQVSHPVLNL